MPDKDMTLLGAVSDDDGIWIVADSRHVAENNGDAWGNSVEKLFTLSDRLMWGWYGDRHGRELEHFMDAITFDGWADLKDKCFREAATLREGGVLGMLIAGYLDGERIVHHIGPALDRMETESTIFCGTCKMAATVGWESATVVDSDADSERRLNVVMETVVRVSNGVLGAPHALWRITPHERTQVRFAVAG